MRRTNSAKRIALTLLALSSVAVRCPSAKAVDLAASRIDADTAGHWWTPDYIPFHTGNYQGLVSAGCGYRFSPSIDSELLLGYVPRSVGGIGLRQVAFKNHIALLKYRFPEYWVAAIYTGLGFLYGRHEQLFVRLPDKYPNGYYPPSALRYLLFAGVKLRAHQNYEYLFEYSWLDSQLERTYEDRKIDRAFRLGTYGLGIRYWMAAHG